MVVLVAEAGGMKMIVQLAVGQRSGFQTSIHTRLVECKRVGRYEHSDVGKNRSVVLGMAIAIR